MQKLSGRQDSRAPWEQANSQQKCVRVFKWSKASLII